MPRRGPLPLQSSAQLALFSLTDKLKDVTQQRNQALQTLEALKDDPISKKLKMTEAKLEVKMKELKNNIKKTGTRGLKRGIMLKCLH